LAYDILLLIVGLVGLILGAELLIRGSLRLARAFGMTPLLAGLIVASIGTSTPELTVSVSAAVSGSADLALANVIGSNIANIALILGICAILRPIAVQVKLVRADVPLMILVTIAGIGVMWNGMIGRMEGAILLLALVAYLWYSVVVGRSEGEDPSTADVPDGRIRSIVLAIVGVAILVVAGSVLVGAAQALALDAGISERVIGMTLVAVGTSLPELATSVIATLRRHADVAVGNVVGSNIFNILGILGISALVSPIVAQGLGWRDLIMLAATAVILLPLVRSGFSISRLEGVILLASYAGYIILVTS
jgi:cation:H+ antiporter